MIKQKVRIDLTLIIVWVNFKFLSRVAVILGNLPDDLTIIILAEHYSGKSGGGGE